METIMFKQLLWRFALFISLFSAGCTSTINSPHTKLPIHASYAIGSFWNYTETPMAGLRAASIVEGVLSQKGITPYSLIQGVDDIAQNQSKADALQATKEAAQKAGATYLITGEVQEWRYKTGIDAEPVVSYSIKVIKLDDNSVAFNGVGAKSGWGDKSIGIVAQEVAQALIPDFKP
jgi:TolB-like protein